MPSKQRGDPAVSQHPPCPCHLQVGLPITLGLQWRSCGEKERASVPMAQGCKKPNKMQEVSKHKAAISTGSGEERERHRNLWSSGEGILYGHQSCTINTFKVMTAME